MSFSSSRQPLQRKVPQAPAGPVRPPGGEVRGPDGVLHRPVHPQRLRAGIMGTSQVRPQSRHGDIVDDVMMTRLYCTRAAFQAAVVDARSASLAVSFHGRCGGFGVARGHTSAV